MYTLFTDSLESWTTRYHGPKFHAVLCDPPYNLSFMGKAWDQNADYKAWGEALLPHLYPGALVLMFGGTRTWHHLAIGMESAGFEMVDTLMWVYAQGFPKGQDISKLIDKKLGNERGVVGKDKWFASASNTRDKYNDYSSEDTRDVTAPGSTISAPWAGHKTPALKPAHEEIIIFRAPYTALDGLTEAAQQINNLLWTLAKNVALQLEPIVTDTVANTAPTIAAMQHEAARQLDALSPRCMEQTTTTGVEGASPGQMATLPSISAVERTVWNMISLWRTFLDVLSRSMSKSTIETISATTTDLTTLNCLLSQIMRDCTGKSADEIKASGLPSNAAYVDVLLTNASVSLAIRNTSAAERIFGRPSGKDGFGSVLGQEESLVPKWEPILMFRAPAKQTYAELAMQYGSGALNIDGGRITASAEDVQAASVPQPQLNSPTGNVYGFQTGEGRNGKRFDMSAGRYPANLLLECICDHTETVAVTPHGSISGNEPSHTGGDDATCYGEYSRIPFQAYPGVAQAHTNPACPCAQLDAQSGKLTSSKRHPRYEKERPDHTCYGTYEQQKYTDNTYGDSGGASRFFYCAKSSTSERNAGVTGKNNHPCCKPLALLTYLATLLLPPDSVQPRRLLVPFSGSGSEIIGALKAGWDEVIGIEREAEYVAIAEARLAHHTQEAA